MSDEGSKGTAVAVVEAWIQNSSEVLEAGEVETAAQKLQGTTGSVWLHLGTTATDTRFDAVRSHPALRFVRVDVHDGELVVLCDVDLKGGA
jgi:hypothetical protein